MRHLLLCALLTWIYPPAASRAQGTFDLVENGRPAATIVVPTERSTRIEKAASWLQDFIARATGATLPIVDDDSIPAGRRISVGPTVLAERARLNAEGLAWDGCRLTVRDNTLFLLGRDETPAGSEWGGGAAYGTGRAVVTLLEDYIGVRWFMPVPEGVIVPKADRISVPRDLDRTVTPAFAFLHGRYPYGVDTPGSLANNYRTAIKLLSHGGHAYYGWLPAEKYFAAHPEYFAMIDGKRTAEGNHICTSNPEVRQILLREIRGAFDNGYEWVGLGQEDGYEPCQCPECDRMDRFRAVMGPTITDVRKDRGEKSWADYLRRMQSAPCERLMSLHSWIVQECAKSHPDKTVHLLIYWPSLVPGKAFSGTYDNVVGEVAFYNDSYEYMVMDMWKDHVRGLSVMTTWFDLTADKGTFGVMMSPQEVAERIRTYHDKKVIGLYGIHEANWGLQGASYYVMGKMAGDTSRDWEQLVREYCDGLYGDAGDAMHDFFSLLYTRTVLKLGYQWQVNPLGSAADKHLMMYDMPYLRRLDALLQKAETAGADDARVSKLIALTRLQIDYLKLVTEALNAEKTWNAKPNPRTQRDLAERVEAFQQFRRYVLGLDDEYTSAWPAHEWFCKFLVGDGDDNNNYYGGWESRRRQLDLDNLRHIAPGFSGSVMRTPFTLEFK